MVNDTINASDEDESESPPVNPTDAPIDEIPVINKTNNSSSSVNNSIGPNSIPTANTSISVATRPNDDHSQDKSSLGNNTPTTASSSENVTVPSVSDESTSATEEPPVTRPSSCNQDSINPTAPPDESEETIAAISIFFILVLLGEVHNALSLYTCMLHVAL